MDKQNQFLIAIEELKQIAKLQNQILTRLQVEEFFDEMQLEVEQQIFVYEYLKENKIGIDETLNLDDFLTEDDVNYLQLYLEELEQLEKVSDSQKHELIMASIAGDKEAQKRLVEVYLPSVIEISKLYTGQGYLVEDLIGEGNVALTMGVQSINHVQTPSEIDGFLGERIMEAIEKYIEVMKDDNDK